MRTSLSEIAETEAYLMHKCDPDEKLLVDAKLLINPVLRSNTMLQKAIYEAIKFWSRKQMKRELQQIQTNLLNRPDANAFRDEIHHIFKEK